MSNSLSNYAEWTKVFDEIEEWDIGHTDIQIMQSVQQGDIKWVSGTAERFINRLLDVINNRFDKLHKFYNERCSKTKNLFELQKILIMFRKELIFLKQLSSIKVIPEDIQEELIDNIKTFAENTQKDLENTTKKDLSGELKRIVLGNRIDNI